MTEQLVEMDWDALLASEIEWAKKQRRRVKGEEEFEMRVRIVGPGGEVANTPLRWTSENEKRRAMVALSLTCGMVGAKAAIVVSDSRFLNVPNFCKVFKIAEPKPGTYEEWNQARHRIMEGFDHYMGNLPRETWDEALLVFIYGPKVKRFATIPYLTLGDQLEFEPVRDDKEGAVTINMLPPWWIPRT